MRRGGVKSSKMKAKLRAASPLKDSAFSTTIPSKMAYMIAGRRFQDSVLKGLAQSMSVTPASALNLSSSQSLHARKLPQTSPPDSRPKTPVVVVGYPNGFPRGLHIVGNKAKNPGIVTLPVVTNVTQRKQTSSSNTSFDRMSVAVTELSEEELSSKILKSDTPINSPSVGGGGGGGGGVSGGSGSNKRPSNPSNNKDSSAEEDKKVKTEKKLKTNPSRPHPPVAPWREISTFQTPAERRRQTYNNFKMMSPDPPKTPTKSASRQTAKTVVIKLHRNEPGKRDYVSTNSSMSLYSQSQNWSHRKLSNFHNAPAALAISGSGKLRAMRHGVGRERSVTGLAMSFRPQRDYPLVNVKNSPSHTVTSSRVKKSSAPYSSPSAALTPKKSLTTVTGTTTGAQNPTAAFPLPLPLPLPPGGGAGGPVVGQQVVGGSSKPPNSGSRWNNIIQTNPIPAPPSKRQEQARLMNHIINGYAESAVAPRNDAFRDKYAFTGSVPGSGSASGYTAGQRFSGSGAPNKATPFQPTNPAPSPPPIIAVAKPKVMKAPLKPPVHVPGPKRENIYIGHYDGSDDSDSDTEPKNLANSNPA